MDGGIQGKIHFHVPFQIIHDRSRAADSLHQHGMVGHVIGQYIPMTGRRFGIGTIRPELSQDARVIAAFDHIGRVGQAGDRVIGVAVTIEDVEVAGAIIAHVIKAVVAMGTRRNVERHAIVWSQVTVRRNAGHDFLHKLRMAGSAKIRRRSRINPRLRRIGACQGERPHAQPLRAEIGLLWGGGKAVLIYGIDDVQALPVIDVHHGVAETVVDTRTVRGQGRVRINVSERIAHGIVGVGHGRIRDGVGDAIGLPGTVVAKPQRNVVEHRVAHPRWGRGVTRLVVGVVTQREHQVGVHHEGVAGRLGVSMAFRHQAKHREADRVAARDGKVRRGVFAAIDVAHRVAVVGRPRVIHGHGKAEVIARLRRRMRRVLPDGGEGAFVPDPRDAVGRSRVSRADSAEQKQQHGQLFQDRAEWQPSFGIKHVH